jgi:RNA polymerase sigma-70 factor (ECF subfamily)
VSPSDVGDPDAAERSPPDPDVVSETAAVRAAVRAVRGGAREAFGQLLELYQRRLFGLTLMMVRDPEGAEEVTQDAFVRAFTHLDLYDDSRPFYPWLATIAVRLAQNWLRRHSRVTTREGAPIDAEREPASNTDPIDRLITDERDRRLWRSVAALPSGERTAVALYYRQGMKVSDIARALGVTSGTVKTFLFRARRKLRSTVDAAADSERHREKSI